MNFKKKVNGSWADTPHYIHKTDTDTFTTLPAVLYPTGSIATVGLKGNTVQSATPTPQNPVMPQGTGERTGNLFDGNWAQGLINPTTGEVMPSNVAIYTVGYIPIKPNTIYSMSRDKYTSYNNVRFYDTNKVYIGAGTTETIEIISGGTAANPMRTNQNFCCFRIIASTAAYMRLSDLTNDLSVKYMLVEGQYTTSTMPSYEPYGYKIPISSANTTTPVYLGEVETERKIKKLVLTGQETGWQGAEASGGRNRFVLSVSDAIAADTSNPYSICSHLPLGASGATYSRDDVYTIASGKLYMRLTIDYDTLITFKTYLQQQYANGTPVTIWYVLANETTAVVNEPLMKIGDYADEVSNISIPVTAGGDTLSVDTTVQPSEVTVNYKGWHSVADVHERDNGAWT